MSRTTRLPARSTARRRRADADRNAVATLRAAREILAVEPNATVEDIANAAGVTRQTVYAHFKTRDALICEVINAIEAEAAAEMDAARLDEGPAAEAMLRLLDASWRTLHRYTHLLNIAIAEGSYRQDAVFDLVHRLITRGQKDGEFRRELPVPWLATVIITLAHVAGDAAGAGQMTFDEAAGALARSVLTICGVAPATITKLMDRSRSPG